MNSEPRPSGKSAILKWLCLFGGLRGIRGWRKVNGAALWRKAGPFCVPNIAQGWRRHLAGWAAQAPGARPARQSRRGRGRLGRGAGRATGRQHACAQAAAAAEGEGCCTSARARREPARYLEEVGGEVERSAVEERLRGRATVREGGLPSTRAVTGLWELSRDLRRAIYVRREPASFPWCDSVLRGCSAEQ